MSRYRPCTAATAALTSVATSASVAGVFVNDHSGLSAMIVAFGSAARNAVNVAVTPALIFVGPLGLSMSKRPPATITIDGAIAASAAIRAVYGAPPANV